MAINVRSIGNGPKLWYPLELFFRASAFDLETLYCEFYEGIETVARNLTRIFHQNFGVFKVDRMIKMGIATMAIPRVLFTRLQPIHHPSLANRGSEDGGDPLITSPD